MASISKKSIDEVKSRVIISDIVNKYVTLKSAGADRDKGLCPFHNEKTPSFTVSNSRASYKCFGCQESGDVYNFVEKIMGLSFKESVEYVASLTGITLEYEQNSSKEYVEKNKIWGDKNETLEIYKMNEYAMELYEKNMFKKEAKLAIDLLKERNFTGQNCVDYSIGYSLNSWDDITRNLAKKGWTTEQIVASGLGVVNKQGNVNDFFRNRLMFPIRDLSGRVVGFGGRQLEEDPNYKSAKFVNTGLTKVYSKSKILYGIDKARKEIAKNKQVIVVEGYMDVMAMNLSGFQETVAPCGTAFTNEQLMILRRLLGGENEYEGKIIFVFDGDGAGLEAAEKAFKVAKDYVSCCYVAIPKDEMDPCDIRLKYGKNAVEELVHNKIPILEFILKKNIEKYNLTLLEGKNLAIKETNRILNEIKDDFLKDEYKKKVSSWLKIDEEYIKTDKIKSLVQQDYELSKYIKTNQDKLEKELISIIFQTGYRDNDIDKMNFLNSAIKQVFGVYIKYHDIEKTIVELPKGREFISELLKLPKQKMEKNELDKYIENLKKKIFYLRKKDKRKELKKELKKTPEGTNRYNELLKELE